MEDIHSLSCAINQLGVKKFNEKSLFKWKSVSDGYGYTIRIFDNRNRWKKE